MRVPEIKIKSVSQTSYRFKAIFKYTAHGPAQRSSPFKVIMVVMTLIVTRAEKLSKIWSGWILSVQIFAGHSHDWIIITHAWQEAVFKITHTTCLYIYIYCIFMQTNRRVGKEFALE